MENHPQPEPNRNGRRLEVSTDHEEASEAGALAADPGSGPELGTATREPNVSAASDTANVFRRFFPGVRVVDTDEGVVISEPDVPPR